MGIILFSFLLGCHPAKEEGSGNTSLSQDMLSLSQSFAQEKFSDRTILYQASLPSMNWEAIGKKLPADVQVQTLAYTQNQLWIATENHGLYKGDPSTDQWTKSSEGLVGEKITSIDLNEFHMMLGLYHQGLYVSKDQGRYWVSANNGLEDLSVRSILQTEDAILVGTNNGLFRSEKQAKWKQVFEGAQFIYLGTLGEYIVAGTNLGVLLSDDKGVSWTMKSEGMAVHNIALIDGNIIVMYISHGMYLSKDNGLSWRQIDQGLSKLGYVFDVVKVGESWICSNHQGIYQTNDLTEDWEAMLLLNKERCIDLLQIGHTVYAGTVQRE